MLNEALGIDVRWVCEIYRDFHHSPILVLSFAPNVMCCFDKWYNLL